MNYDQYRALLKTVTPPAIQPMLFGISYSKCALLGAVIAIGAFTLYLI